MANGVWLCEQETGTDVGAVGKVVGKAEAAGREFYVGIGGRKWADDVGTKFRRRPGDDEY